MPKKAHWQFPPRNGGIEVIQDPSSAHFSDDPLPKLVREVIQNSLDAKEPGLNNPIQIVFTEIRVNPEDIGANELRSHLEACFRRAKRDKRRPIVRSYERALKAIDSEEIRCLRIVDSGTTGLKGSNWDALVSQEGSVRKDGEAPGGSKGIGKNAVFNVSDLRAVFYSTRYVARGRVEKLQGKATLMAHSDPKDTARQLQHVGFFAASGMNPILGKLIPVVFRLGEKGTGVYVMGFNPRSTHWVDELVNATINNFFYAIHHKRLIVQVKARNSRKTTIDHESLDLLFERQEQKASSYFYYRAIRDEKPIKTESIGKIGSLNVHVLLDSFCPRRIAYVNHNGMLITDIRDPRGNPMAPRGRGLWPNYAVAVVPATAKGDEWIRSTENTSHDSMSTQELFEESARRKADGWFKAVRKSIRTIIDDKAEVQKYGDTSNLDELASMFPDEFDPHAPGNKVLKTRVSRSRVVPSAPGQGSGLRPGADDDYGSGTGMGMGEGDGGERGGGQGNGNGKGTPPGSGPGSEKGRRSARTPRLQRPRFILTGPSRATVAFSAANPGEDVIDFALIPAGSEWTRENKIDITEARVISPLGQQVQVDGGVVSLTPKSEERIVMEIATSENINNLAFRMV